MNNKKCVSCGKCKSNCLFLKKYDLDFSNRDKLKEKAFGCTLCGKCTAVCPVGIDGRAEILELRREIIRENNGKVPHKGYGIISFEKKNYLFRNIKRANSGIYYFPGCSFPSYFPNTNIFLINEFKKRDIGLFFDCCGKPIFELGLIKEEDIILKRLDENFKKFKVKKIIAVCPNCYHFLKNRVNIEIQNIYEAIKDYDLGSKLSRDEENIFLPCSDRYSLEIFESLKKYLPEKTNFIEELQCCGLGGGSYLKEMGTTLKLSKCLTPLGYKDVLTYCASCSGIFQRNNPDIKVRHALPEILKTGESPDFNHGFLNRLKAKFK